MDLIQLTYSIFLKKQEPFLRNIEDAIFNFIDKQLSKLSYNYQEVWDSKIAGDRAKIEIFYANVAKLLLQLEFPEDTVNEKITKTRFTDPLFLSFSTIGQIKQRDLEPKLKIILFHEILKEMAGCNSNISKIFNQTLIDLDIYSNIKEIGKKFPKIRTFFEWYFLLKTHLTSKFKSNSPDFRKISQFTDPEKDLQTFYILYRIAEIQNYASQLDFSPVVSYLKNHVNEWTKENPNLGEKYPLSLYCGIYLGKKLGVNYDNALIEKALNTIFLKLRNGYSCPLFENTFLSDNLIQTCRILNIDLSQEYFKDLTKFDKDLITPTKMKYYSTTRISKIYQIYRDMNLQHLIDGDLRRVMFNIVQNRVKDKIFMNYDLDILPSPQGIDSALMVYSIENLIPQFDFYNNIEFVGTFLKNNLMIFDLGFIGPLSDIYFAVKFFDHFSQLPEDFVKNEVSRFLFESNYIPSGKKPISIPIGQKPQIQIRDSRTIPEDINVIIDSTLDEVDAIDIEPLNDEELKTLEFDILPDDSSEGDTIVLNRTLPHNYWDFFGDFPALFSNIADELKFNFSGLVNKPDDLFSSLESIFKWIVSLKVLNLDSPLSRDEIYIMTAKYQKPNGFGLEDSEEVVHMPDPVNTFYGLSIYSELNLMDVLHLEQIYKYLTDEITQLHPAFVKNNYYTFSSLRILQKFDVLIADFSYLIPKLEDFIFGKNEPDEITNQLNIKEKNILSDLFYTINTLKAINPLQDVTKIGQFYLSILNKSIDGQGTIEYSPQASAKALICLHELNISQAPEIDKLLTFIKRDYIGFSQLNNGIFEWEKDLDSYLLELNSIYWVLSALTLQYPAFPSIKKSKICPKCYKYFSKPFQICGNCGNKME